ncbi:uncharacterized protein LOC105438885 [Strongylocentrotus purpuratus]|uniref:Death domain-containing protein n=1 Tax=Strongylocentrotus purpuratus TaxID=7668 RepID=A0A7M7N119_STRPU|nr:uncharacterized protein LOC105438885 [Strongylocentrotus purpuratus]
MEHSKDASDLQGDMDTCSGSDCGELGAEGGLAFKIDREGVIKGQMKEDEKGNDAHSGKDDVVLSDLAMHLLPENLTPLGLRLGLSNIIINQIRFNNPLSIGNAIYQVLQEWKGIICAGCLTEEHFKTLEQCLRKIGHEDAADWLIERLHKSTDQLGQPSPSPGQLVQPASSDSQ